MVSKSAGVDYEGNKRYISATLSLIYMGLGQIYNGQYIKGIGFMIFWTAMLFQSVPYFIENISPLSVDAETVREAVEGAEGVNFQPAEGASYIGMLPGAGNDHSLFILVFGLVAVGLLLILLGVYIFNIFDAYRNGSKLDLGFEPSSFSDSISNGIRAMSTIGYLIPGLFIVAVTIIFPVVFTVLMAFTNYNLYNAPPRNLVRWIGFDNFEELFTFVGVRETFFRVFGWTVVWALLATFITYALGLFFAIILDKKEMKGRNIIRTVLLVPWAIPPFVSLLIWHGLLNVNFGHVNVMLTRIGIGRIPWLVDKFWARVSVLGVNLWISFPFCMAVCLGILQSIDKNLYKAAEVDGATKFQQFRTITLPLVLRQLTPLLIMQFAFQFNNFNIIYLLTGGGPADFGLQMRAQGTDILISWVFKLTVEALQYGRAAAISIVIFIILAGFSIYQFTRTKAFKEEGVDY